MAKRPAIDNPDFIPVAFYLLGASGRYVDVEDAFVKCFELAPERFGWRKYEFPNYKTVSKALRDFEGKRPGLLMKSPDGLGLTRQLTAEGVAWVEERRGRFEALASTPELRSPMLRPVNRMLNDLANQPAVKEFLAGARPDLEKHVAADLRLCSPDSSKEVWRERLESFRSASGLAKRPDLLRFLDYLASEYSEWFGR